MKTYVFAVVGLLTLNAGAALANDPLTSSEECLKIAFDIAQAAESQNLPTEQLDRIEDLLTRMETHCDAKQFTEAATVADNLKLLLAKS